MDSDALISVVVALACVAGVGMTAASMESAVETTPDDVIDVEASSVPLGAGEIREYKERLQGAPRQEEAASGDESASVPADETTSRPAPKRGADTSSDPAGGAADRQRPATTEGPGPGPGKEGGPADPSLLDRLLSFLRWLLATLLTALPFLVGLSVAALAVANRDRLAALGGDDGDGEEAPTRAAEVRPQNDVAAAWYEMVDRAGVERPATKTPRQCAAAAVDAGADSDAVASLTDLFEAVRYGDAAVTDERRRRAREALDRLNGGGGR